MEVKETKENLQILTKDWISSHVLYTFQNILASWLNLNLNSNKILLHLFMQIIQLLFKLQLILATPLYADNTIVIQISANPIFMKGPSILRSTATSSLILLKKKKEEITLPCVSTELQNVFTKALMSSRHQFLISKLMSIDFPATIWGGTLELAWRATTCTINHTNL